MSAWSSIPFPAAIQKFAWGRNNQIPASAIRDVGKWPVVDQGQGLVAGYCDEDQRVVREGLPVVIFGDHTRRFKFVDFPFVLGADGTKVLKASTELFDPKFFYYALLSLDIPNRGYNRHYTLLNERSIPRPYAEEQRRIAAALGVVELAIEQQERLLALTGELKRALALRLFSSGIGGQSPAESEIGPTPASWAVRPLGEQLLLAQYGLSIRGGEAGPHALLRMTNQRDGRIVGSDLQYVDLPPGQLRDFRLARGDLLFNRTNSFELVGRTALFDLEGDFTFASYLIRLRTDEARLRPAFLNHYLNSPETQRRLKSIATRAVSQSNLSATRLRGFPVPVPSPEEQDEIVSALDAVDAKANLHARQRDALSALFRTLLHQLMTGQLRVHDLDLAALEPALA